MEDDELLFEIKERRKKVRSSFQSILNKKIFNKYDLESAMLGEGEEK